MKQWEHSEDVTEFKQIDEYQTLQPHTHLISTVSAYLFFFVLCVIKQNKRARAVAHDTNRLDIYQLD